jgi:hypothetical protein
MATVLDKELKRQVTIDGAAYTVAVDPDGLRLTGKGKRTPEVELRWRELLSGDAAMAVALNASLSKPQRAAVKPASEPSADRASTRAPARTPTSTPPARTPTNTPPTRAPKKRGR